MTINTQYRQLTPERIAPAPEEHDTSRRGHHRHSDGCNEEKRGSRTNFLLLVVLPKIGGAYNTFYCLPFTVRYWGLIIRLD